MDAAVDALREGSVAILVRSRPHLTEIARELRQRDISFHGEELTPLAETSTVRDIRSLASALMDSGDRLAWLSVLRAPWCGLELTDLHRLAAGDMRPIPQLLDDPDLHELALDEEEADDPVDYDVDLQDLVDLVEELEGRAPAGSDDES